jgi:hypothetical protein
VVDLNGRRAGSDGDLPYSLEGAAESSSPNMKRTRSDHAFTFEEGARNEALATVLGARTREQGGLGIATVTGFWVGAGAGTVSRNAFVSRQALGIEPVTFLTYYAYVSEGAQLLHGIETPGATGRYGNEGCAAGTFDCDATRWWLDDAGNDITPRDSRLGVDPSDPGVPAQTNQTRIGVRVGQPYQMRDIDCIDSSFSIARDSGIHWGTLTGTACPRPLS